MGILIKSARISGFRGLKNIEVELEKTTILTGMNNAGKTSFLKAIQVALGNRQFISQDDFFIFRNQNSQKVTIDLLIIPSNGEEFSEDWEVLLTTERLRVDAEANSYVPMRTVVTFDPINNSFKTEQFILSEWPAFNNENVNWFDFPVTSKSSFKFDEMPFFYMDAQRDIIEDTKLKNSYLGRMLSKIEYSDEDILAIETQIQSLNERTVEGSPILSNIKSALQNLDSALGSNGAGIDLTPFTKKIRDLSKGLSIYYTDNEDSFSMEYHGMGTRSWSSLLVLKAFISLLSRNSGADSSVFFPVLCIEEPEAHLHPNAQKKLYSQMNEIEGQKIISTHSPYIAAAAELKQIRNFYKSGNINIGAIDVTQLSSEDERKINRQVVNTRGEMFFSKLIVLFEGETEEQALPIFFEKYFGKTPVEMGVDFIGVGGYTCYLPFLRFTESLKIPTLILSDADGQHIIDKVNSQFATAKPTENPLESIIFLDNGNDFERQLIVDGFQASIRKTILSFDEYTNEQHRNAAAPRRALEVEGFNDDILYENLTANKTKCGPVVAENIIRDEEMLPSKVTLLFDKISDTLSAVEE
ncbi:AAA family ATPase [Agarivorans sp. Z349TD_8]|uniref:AAA family ATPase n=1 Tax=Agarivorans sp. Z349TD_8 TaxID=3421434 RepID=UPI003D7E72F4